MKRSGSVTVFLALVITCSSALICALTESARTAGARFYVRTMADSAIDSLFSLNITPNSVSATGFWRTRTEAMRPARRKWKIL